MSAKVFVGNLNYRTTEQQLRRFLSETGEVKSVSMPLDRETGQPRGFAFVEFASEEQAEMAATVYDGRVLGGRPLRVKMADDRPARRAPAPSLPRRPSRDEEDDEYAFDEDDDRRANRRDRREWRQMRRTKRSL